MPEEILIVAISGRALAQSAVRSGRRVRVLDAFADVDTQRLAQTQCVAADGTIALDDDKLSAALDALTGRSCIIVAGSGFERAPRALDRLAARGTLCANDPDLVAGLKDPELGAELLRALGWQVPEIRREPPADPSGWLQKEIGGAGGVHVRRAWQAARDGRAYYQREVAGRPMSVTFLADARRAWVLGFNALMVRAVGEVPFCHAGASTCSLEPALERDLQARLDRLVRLTGLRGLNGVDFMLDGSELYALEVNPRPTATFELYDSDYAEGLVAWHVRSFAGPLSDFPVGRPPGPRSARACAIVYAERALNVPAGVQFPAWCRDLPASGSRIAAGAPVLSVFAEADDEIAVQRLLCDRRSQVLDRLQRWHAEARAECPV
jgi:predicted ATP-grasp superfamily ATP-dependent carboligase